jgi:FkbM family methyltransferase
MTSSKQENRYGESKHSKCANCSANSASVLSPLKAAAAAQARKEVVVPSFTERYTIFKVAGFKQVTSEVSVNKTLVYVGVNRGNSFRRLIDEFDQCFGFEPVPFFADKLIQEFRETKKVEILPVAVGLDEGISEFYISTQDGGKIIGDSSSLYPVSDFYRENGPKNDIKTFKSVRVRTVNLNSFLASRYVNEIELLVLDAEGADYQIARSIEPYFRRRAIKRVQVECEPDYAIERQRVGQPGNFMTYFLDLLLDDYDLVDAQRGVYDPTNPGKWFNRDLTFRVKRP